MNLFTKHNLEAEGIVFLKFIHDGKNHEYHSANYHQGCDEKGLSIPTLVVIKYNRKTHKIKFMTPEEYVLADISK